MSLPLFCAGSSGSTGSSGSAGNGGRTAGPNLPSTRAGGQDGGSYTNSLKLSKIHIFHFEYPLYINIFKYLYIYINNINNNLREFMLTTVILAPGACWGGSDTTVLAQNRCKTGQSRPAPARTGNNRVCSRNIWSKNQDRMLNF